ncbi:transposase [Candidatus Shapirobacteria bacterium]|nr:transposase [Candidatus Shapirobacteria bacterium]
MPKGQPSVSKEVKEQILKRIKEEGVPVAQVAQEHGLKPKVIYGWIARGVTASPSILEIAKLKRENQALKELIGQVTLEVAMAKKKGDDR